MQGEAQSEGGKGLASGPKFTVAPQIPVMKTKSILIHYFTHSVVIQNVPN